MQSKSWNESFHVKIQAATTCQHAMTASCHSIYNNTNQSCLVGKAIFHAAIPKDSKEAANTIPILRPKINTKRLLIIGTAQQSVVYMSAATIAIFRYICNNSRQC